MRVALVLLVAACSKKETPPPTPTPAPADAPAYVGCPYEIWPPHLAAIDDGTVLISPQSVTGSAAPQYGPEHVLSADGTVVPATKKPRTKRDRSWFVGDDGGSICVDRGEASTRDCVEYELDAELAKLRGYAASAIDPQGRYFTLSFTDESKDPWEDFAVGFDGTGKRLATWKPARGCDERPELVIRRYGYALCRRDDDGNDLYSSWIVRDLTSGQQLAEIEGRFDDMRTAVIDDSHFVAYRPDTKTFEAYDVSTASSPKRTWSTPTTLVTPSIVAGAGGIVAIEQASPWRAVILDAATGSVRRELVIDPCRK